MYQVHNIRVYREQHAIAYIYVEGQMLLSILFFGFAVILIRISFILEKHDPMQVNRQFKTQFQQNQKPRTKKNVVISFYFRK